MSQKQILYGVGKSVMKDFVDPTKIVALSKLKDVTINFSGQEEPVNGGDSPFPITSFPRDKAISVTATNALFSMDMMNITQGAVVSKGVVDITEFVDGTIPNDGIVELDHTPIAGSVIISGYEEVDDEESLDTGSFYVDAIENQILFDVKDAGKEIEGIYERKSSADAQTLSGLEDTMAKPVIFIHRIPVYDDNSTIVSEGQLILYKAKANNSFEFNFAPQTAFAPKLELNAHDPKRTDRKLWDFTLEPVTV